MNLKLCGVIAVCGGILLCLMVFGQCEAQSNQKGSAMFSFLFGKKPAPSKVALEVGATLQRQNSLPKQFSSPATPSFPQCQSGYIRGNPLDAKWVTDGVPGETQHVFHIPANGTTPSLAILSTPDGGKEKQVQVWELSAEKPRRFVRQRQVVFPPGLSSSTYTFPTAVVTLPGQQAAVTVGFLNPAPRNVLLIYDTANNSFRHVDRIEPEYSSVAGLKFFESMSPTPESLLLVYHTKAIRITAENHAYENDHVLLFSPRFPQGLEIIRLSVGDGNVRAWGMLGKTLWLQTLDKRKKPEEFIWSLDLTAVL